jgi:hypothetical protein
MVCAVSPAQNNPLGLLHNARKTYGKGSSNVVRLNRSTRTNSINQKIVLRFINISVKGLTRETDNQTILTGSQSADQEHRYFLATL